ncbi:MAG: glycosyltransferase family 39 protein [Rhizobiales bacterium]|nr:glycosyltransferase family 39 protein [Hyphomicrobiales bacterium]
MTTTVQEFRQPGLTGYAERILAFATASHTRAAAVLLVVALLSFLPGFFQIPETDRDESRFAQATKQMLESGDFIDIRFQNEVRYKKPVGIYWLQAAAVRAGEAVGVPQARTKIWLYRIPSLIGAIGAVLLTYWVAIAVLSTRGAMLAGLMMAGSVLLAVEARIAKTDAALLLTVVATYGALIRAYLRHPDDPQDEIVMPAVFWTALAAGFLLKGPLILMFVGLTLAVLYYTDRTLAWTKRLRPLFGAPWFLLLVLPWFIAIFSRAGEAFLAESVGHDMLSKVFSGQESHGAPPGYYFLLFWLTFWPGAPLALLAARGVWRLRAEPSVRFLLAWLVPSWLVFELVITKLPHYVLPLYPAIAILTAVAIERSALSNSRRMRWMTLTWPFLTTVAPVLGVLGLIWFSSRAAFVAIPVAVVAGMLGFLAWRVYERHTADHTVVLCSAAAIALYVTAFGFVLPSLRVGFPTPAIARAVTAAQCGDAGVAAAGYHEPSLVFRVGTGVRLTDGSGVADFMRDGDCRIGIVERRQERAFLRRAEALGLRYSSVRRIEAFTVNGGRNISVGVYRSGGGP